LPHLSFDLDGDGCVSATDFFLAKQFDKDKDGKLNDEELASAMKALSLGYKDKFMFGIERSGPIQSTLQLVAKDATNKKNLINPIRILQKEGKILVGEDFTPLQEI